MFVCKTVSSMEKIFLTADYDTISAIEGIRLYKNQCAPLQLLPYDEEERENPVRWIKPEICGPLAPYITFRSVESVANPLPLPQTKKLSLEKNPDFIATTPGLYPDLLAEPTHGGFFPLVNQQCHPLWVTIDPKEELSPGVYPVTVTFTEKNEGTELGQTTFTVEILPATLPPQNTRVSMWMYADSLADYYEVPVFSDRHFAICENYIQTAVKNGINMVLTPIFTPPLDTAVGGERTTTQLVGVCQEGETYTFDFSLLDRWIDMLNRCGVAYIELSHLFTQWGGFHAPKIMAGKGPDQVQIFGWETKSDSPSYVNFIRQFIKAITSHLEARGDKERTYFHLSDEPEEAHLAQYRKNRENIGDLLAGWKVLDALSRIDFYKEGLCDTPVPISSSIEDFMKEDIKERFVYYCCGPWEGYSNRFLSNSMACTRSIGYQMYVYGIQGFLHWGYNFYGNQFSEDVVNPFLNMTAGYWTAAGDACIVYPGRGGVPIESMRLSAIKQAIDDIRAMELCEGFYGKEKVVAEIQAIVGPVSFAKCVHRGEQMEALRKRIDQLNMAAIKNNQ